jgi:hypothetical protein
MAFMLFMVPRAVRASGGVSEQNTEGMERPFRDLRGELFRQQVMIAAIA